jgi:hypothetical protein
MNRKADLTSLVLQVDFKLRGFQGCVFLLPVYLKTSFICLLQRNYSYMSLGVGDRGVGLKVSHPPMKFLSLPQPKI